MEDQRRDIVKGIWFLALMFSLLISSVRCQSDPSTTLEVSPNMTVQREGTTVSLLCHVSSFNASTHFLSWFKEGPGSFVVTSNNLPVSYQRYLVSFTEGVISTFNLTFTEVETTDTGTYDCNLIRPTGDTSSAGVLLKKLVLSVYPRDAFPSCNPNGPETLTVGSLISCSTSGRATISIDAEYGEWAHYSYSHGGKALLFKNVTTSDNSQTYICVANLPSSDMNLSCTIGPLIVVDIESTTQTTTTTTTRPTGVTVVKSGLSVVQITGIVIGVVVLIILIVIHVLCFRFDPRRWRLAKDFLIDCGSSRETQEAQEDASRSPPDVPMSRDGDDVPHVYCSTLKENPQPGLPSIQPVEHEKDANTREADPYMELDTANEKPSQYAELKL